MKILLKIMIPKACLFLALVYYSSSSNPFKVCGQTDPNINTCLISAIENALQLIQNGIPGVPSMQPMNINDTVVKAKPPLPYDQKYTNWKMYNFALSKIIDVSLRISGQRFFLTLSAYNDEVNGRAEYQYDNAVLDGVDLSSSGNFSYTYDSFEFRLNLTGDIVKRNEMETIEITDTVMELVSIETFISKFESDDIEKARRLNDFYNHHAQNMLTKSGGGYWMTYAGVFKDIANSIFKKFPFDQLFPK